MDNKRWGKRFSTIFWWTLTILPLIVVLVQFIGYHLTFNSGITTAEELSSYHNDSTGDFISIFLWYLDDGDYVFGMFSLPFLQNVFIDLFHTLHINGENALGILFGWMASVQMYHLCFDFFAWLPRLFHSWMDRWCVE